MRYRLGGPSQNARRLSKLGLAALGLLWPLSSLLAAGPAPARATDAALARVEAYNSRSFGNPGRRHVRLELYSGDVVTRTFEVSNLWRKDDGITRTLFLLHEPRGLAGTNYLLVEDPSSPAGMEVYLHLPAGERKVLTVRPGSFDEGLLGSDFGYRDLRLQLPVAGWKYSVVGKDRLLGRPVLVLEAVSEDPASPRRTRYYLSENPALLLGIDHLEAVPGGAPQVVRRMRVGGLSQVAGAWTETRMVMTAGEGHSSVLTLEGFEPSYGQALAEMFTPAALPSLAERLATLPASPRPEAGR